MRVVSLNAWGGAMYDALRDWLPGCGADVLCLQEVTRTAGLDGWTRFEDSERTLPQRANLFDDVARALPNHQAMLVTSDAGPVTDHTGGQHQQDFGIAMFVHERFPVVGAQTRFVHGDFLDHDAWAIADRPRVAQAARIVDRDAGRFATIAHLHGLRDPSGKHDSPARLAQARRLANLITSIRQPDDFVVTCGDFNLLPDSETFQLLAEIGLVDLVGHSDTRTSRYEKPIRSANYMLVSDPDVVAQFDCPALPEVSDHRFLVLDV